MVSSKRTAKDVEDPLLRACPACPACGARVGQGCRTRGKNDTRFPRASRLVHAARLEQIGGDHG